MDIPVMTADSSWQLPADSLLAVIGHPIGHSLSPVMHTPALAAAGIAGVYGIADVRTEELGKWCTFAAKHLKGFNITVPHKENIIQFLDKVDPVAAAAGSVNTVRVGSDGTLSGTSTDGGGFLDAAAETLGFSPAGSVIAIAGAGGAARGIAFACAAAGAKEIMIFNRSRERSGALAADLQKHFPGLTVSLWQPDEADTPGLLEASELFIQATSLGLKADDPLPVPAGAIARCRRVYDCIYGTTRVLHTALDNGVPCADGTLMLLYQGARAFEYWFGQKPDVDIMKKSLAGALAGRVG